jgi:AcrR family transcriptional regulator
MKSPRIDIASIRREQIIEAAVAVITERGLQKLSLSAIEKTAGMSRGQLTYYFPAKEDILLAVFDRLLQLIYQRFHSAHEQRGEPNPCEVSVGCWIGLLLESVLLRPPVSPEFHTLQYTFLSQISHRDDFRQRLARLYEEWRTHMSQGLAEEAASPAPASPRTMASFVQAVLHGLSMQLAADPKAFDRVEMLQLCQDVIGRSFQLRKRPAARRPRSNTNGVHPDARVPPDRRPRSSRNKVNHE